jgi:hypothetical protein
MKVSFLVWKLQKIASELYIEPIFPTKCQRKRKRHFDDQDDQDEELQQSAMDTFRREYFLIMIDHAIASLNSRFEHMTVFDNIFGFLFNSKNLKFLDEVDLWAHCKIFVDKFSHDNLSDVEINDFFQELKVLRMALPDYMIRRLKFLSLLWMHIAIQMFQLPIVFS